MKKYKVFSLGQSQINFMGQLYGGIQQKTEKFIFDIDFFFDNSEGKTPAQRELYNDFYELRNTKISKLNGIKYFFKALKSKAFRKIISFEIYNNPKKIISSIKKNIKNLFITETITSNNNHTLFHLHSCTPIHLKNIYYLPKKTSIICSFWGMDVYTKGISNFFYTSLALEKASIITIQNIELKEVVLAKYGQHLDEKIRVVRFPMRKNIFDKIDELKDNHQKIIKFKNKFEINSEKKVVTVGYNAHENNNHIEIINKLNNLDEVRKSKLVVLLPLMYGRHDDYLTKINKAIDKTKGLEFAFIHEYLNWEEVALLKIISDLTIQMPKSDALSASVLEALYSNNIVLSGSWLPYGDFRRNGANFIEIENFSKLESKLSSVIDNFEKVKTSFNSNSINIRENYLSDSEINKWIDIYNELLSIEA